MTRRALVRALVRAGLVSALTASAVTAALAQPYVDGGNTRHRFAQLSIGADARAFTADGSTAEGPLQDARLVIGGPHFWGHAELFVAVPVAWSGRTGYKTRVETGARWYPWRIERGAVRPYAGASLLGVTYEELGGPRQTRIVVPLTAGVTYQRGDGLLTLGGGWVRHESRYARAPGSTVPVTMHPLWLGVGYSRVFDATLGAEPAWKSGETEVRVLRLRDQRRLSGWTVTAGASTAFFLRRSSELTAIGFAGQHEVAAPFGELGVGYYFADREVQFNLLARRSRSEVRGFGYAQTATRTAVTAEWFLFLFDYHGFMPFVGPNLSNEVLRVSGDATGEFEGISAGYTFGWEIRPDPLQAVTLRTSARWVRRLGVPLSTGRSVHLDQLEVSFLQVVVYPGRLRGSLRDVAPR
jgi:hypothetical protein